jgi:RNA polymerase sigma factor (TIGR02999 family)
MSNSEKTTQLLKDIEQGHEQAANELMPLVYNELRRLAAHRLTREPRKSLNATGLVHEAYVRLVGSEDPGWNGKTHFFGAAAEAMRRVLIDRARRARRQKRGGGQDPVQLSESLVAGKIQDEELLGLDEALIKLEQEDRVKAKLVKLRYFGGLSAGEAAKMLDISRATADRYWAYARAWLYSEMTKNDE